MQSQILIYARLTEKNTERGCIPLNQLSQKTWCEVAAKFKPKPRNKNQAEFTKCSTLKEKDALFF